MKIYSKVMVLCVLCLLLFPCAAFAAQGETLWSDDPEMLGDSQDQGHQASKKGWIKTTSPGIPIQTQPLLLTQEKTTSPGQEPEDEDYLSEKEQEAEEIADPLEPINRVFFHFNDKLYFWVLKPVARAYGWLFPEPIRIGVRNFFSNLTTPIRAANCLLQLKIEGFGREVARFTMNTTAGVLGFVDVATRANVPKQDEDFGQTLGFYGLGPGIYIVWPFLGPSSARDSIGIVADAFLNPTYYIVEDNLLRAAVETYRVINKTSLTIGTYESLKKGALDPYLAVMSAYHQNRQKKIKE